VRKLILLTTLALLGTAGIAAAAGSATVTAKLSPNQPKRGSSVQATASGFTTTGQLPTALTVTLPKGFTTAVNKQGVADSTNALCTTTQEGNNDCPDSTGDDSQIGQGTATVTVSAPSTNPLAGALGNTTETVNLTFFIGKGPAASKCPATVDVVFQNSALPTEHEVGDLCKVGGGLQLSFTNLPTYSSQLSGSGVTATLTQMYVALGAHNEVKTTTKKTVKKNGKKTTKKVTTTTEAYLLNNPGSCPSSRQWVGSFAVTFGSAGTTTSPVDLACSK
jgi:hypothetical protein